MTELAAFAVVWLVTWLLHSSVLTGLAWLLDRPALLRTPAAREHVWRAALLGALLTATVQSAGLVQRVPLGTLLRAPRSDAAATAAAPLRAPGAAFIPAPHDGASDARESAEPVQRGDALARTAATASSPVPTPSAAAAAPAVAPSPLTGTVPARTLIQRIGAALAFGWAQVLLAIWLAGAAFAGLRLLVLAWLARRELAARAPAQAPLATEFAALCAALGVRAPRLSVAPALAGPVSLPNREIVVPPWAAESLDRRQRRALLAHELAHQVRRDPQWLAVTLALHALLWLHPLNGLLRRRLAALAELQADAWAARAVADPRGLAQCLAACAERLHDGRVARFGAAARFGTAMTGHHLLVERVDRLLGGSPMSLSTTSWPLRGGVVAALLASTFLLPGCDDDMLSFGISGSSTQISVSDDEASITVKRPGYALHMETDGRLTYAADESDIATLQPGCTFKLMEKRDGTKHEITVTSDRAGALTRSYERDDQPLPLDADAAAWLAGALPRMFRESGFDAEARVARLLAAGGPSAVLAEVELTQSDYARSLYLGTLLGSPGLDGAQTAQAFAAAASIGSDHELAELLVSAAPGLPAEAHAAWLAAAATLDSDYDLGRTLRPGLQAPSCDGAFAAQILAVGAEEIDSSYELGELLKAAVRRASDPTVAAACLAATRELDSNFERANALRELLAAASLDAASLRTFLEVTHGIDSSHERCEVLKAVAGKVAADPDLNRLYRDAASSLADYERGAALLALDDAMRN